MTTYAFVPARGGSNRIPDKNLQQVRDGKHEWSLVHIAIEDGMDSCDRVVLGTDSPVIMGEITIYMDADPERFSAHDRPPQLAGPYAQIEDAILHWGRRADLADDDVICLLQPTSPFRRIESVRACVDAVASGEHESALTVTLDGRAPFRGRKLLSNGVALWERPKGWTRPRSQDIRKQPEEAGSVYAFSWRHLKRTGQRMGEGAYCVVVDRFEALEIDTPQDLELARVLAPHVDELRRV